MYIKVKVFPNSKVQKVVKKRKVWEIYVKSKAEKGEANTEVIEILSAYGANARIIKGFRARNKLIEIE